MRGWECYLWYGSKISILQIDKAKALFPKNDFEKNEMGDERSQ